MPRRLLSQLLVTTTARAMSRSRCLWLSALGLSACSPDPEPAPEQSVEARPAVSPSEPTEAEAQAALTGRGPSLWRAPLDAPPWAPTALQPKSEAQRVLPRAAILPEGHTVEFAEMGWLGEELLVRGGLGLGDVVFRFDRSGTLLGTLDLDALVGEVAGVNCKANEADPYPLEIGSEGWFATSATCFEADYVWLMSFDAQARVVARKIVTPRPLPWATVAGRRVVFDYRHENNYDTLLVGYDAEGGEPWRLEVEDKLSGLTGVGDRLFCSDFSDHLVELDPETGARTAEHALPNEGAIRLIAPAGEGELAIFFTRDPVVIVDRDSGEERRRFELRVGGERNPMVWAAWPGPEGGFVLHVEAPEGELVRRDLWLVDRAGRGVERLAGDVIEAAVTEVGGGWRWAAAGRSISLPNAVEVPKLRDESSADLLVLGELR
ncbi:hypothetical protein PPSIR1_18977 [Plesiocystis pacifica SIR-1]|uniref:Lipoprotein n=1 Tax=Plesiocystis pacifica SIR-1 TaxID=391625 RepID=A6GGL2_9BACT|nr:hypothetical protein [Plesiocystis pacifica]EDM74972.1 hypothetical protein PPSIR1_18977 [Plesiocystis pacifica SIR-1]